MNITITEEQVKNFLYREINKNHKIIIIMLIPSIMLSVSGMILSITSNATLGIMACVCSLALNLLTYFPRKEIRDYNIVLNNKDAFESLRNHLQEHINEINIDEKGNLK